MVFDAYSLSTLRYAYSPMYIVFAMLMVPFALASQIATACSLHGYLAAKAGYHNHAHFADVLKTTVTLCEVQLDCWLAHSLWAARFVDWYLPPEAGPSQITGTGVRTLKHLGILGASSPSLSEKPWTQVSALVEVYD